MTPVFLTCMHAFFHACISEAELVSCMQACKLSCEIVEELGEVRGERCGGSGGEAQGAVLVVDVQVQGLAV